MFEPNECPFCGGQAEVTPYYEYGKVKAYFVFCKSCFIEQGNHYRTKSNAIKAWNRRVVKNETGIS